jgi:membrane-bound lytic murein transglycosylase D
MKISTFILFALRSSLAWALLVQPSLAQQSSDLPPFSQSPSAPLPAGAVVPAVPVAPALADPEPQPLRSPSVQQAPAQYTPAVDAPPHAAPQHAPTAEPAMVITIQDAPALPPPLVAQRPTNDRDLWERIRRGFAVPDLADQFVTNQEQWYSSRPDYIQRMTERGSKYLYHIVEEVERRNMPMELALLPFIESAFNPQAMSSAKASGMWQFMPATGKYFSLKQSVFKDDRRDVLASTRAALDYLQKLHKMFGDWQLALAAYNWGEGSVGRAIAKNQREGLPTDYASLNMPNETRNYVPKLQAVKNIVQNPGAYNASLPDVANHPYFQSVNLTRDMDVALVAKLAEMKVEDFKQLNPSANKPVMFASGTPYILLPWDNASTYESNLAGHKGQTSGWTVWTAPSTFKVADAARRAGMGEAQFREINRIPPRMLIKAGSTLLVPRLAKHQNDVALHIVDHGQVSLAPEIVLRKQSIKLKKAETVASIAKRYNVSVANVASWNKVSATGSFKAKQSVVLHLPVKAKSAKGGRGTKVGKAVRGGHAAKTGKVSRTGKAVASKKRRR